VFSFAVGTTKRTRKSVEQVASKTQDEASAMKSLLSTKPTASALSVSVDDDDPTEEEVEQAVRFCRGFRDLVAFRNSQLGDSALACLEGRLLVNLGGLLFCWRWLAING
jgi:hypothetical protein